MQLSSPTKHRKWSKSAKKRARAIKQKPVDREVKSLSWEGLKVQGLQVQKPQNTQNPSKSNITFQKLDG
jgi:hypothetical protein